MSLESWLVRLLTGQILQDIGPSATISQLWGRKILWAGAGPPGGTVRRAAVRKRGPGSTSLH